jgi:hypothetical protein
MSVDRGVWSVAGTTTLDRECGITMFNTSNKVTGGLGISYSSRKVRGKVLNFM